MMLLPLLRLRLLVLLRLLGVVPLREGVVLSVGGRCLARACPDISRIIVSKWSVECLLSLWGRHLGADVRLGVDVDEGLGIGVAMVLAVM